MQTNHTTSTAGTRAGRKVGLISYPCASQTRARPVTLQKGEHMQTYSILDYETGELIAGPGLNEPDVLDETRQLLRERGVFPLRAIVSDATGRVYAPGHRGALRPVAGMFSGAHAG